ncbi:tyrosine-protein phosphatase non-receptor type 22 isoform X2 [Silurus meridionalis]|uniref:protein-tyrosine-phosphatase n=1 Tax=Silurus meridionalis TaxID=175797 RepID=A0A8T0AY14_SILME|nr:tyrosine-protein phosphatase non-receptor type 22 isoform X2 [Silurus meridionalis]KAF7696159.1 hypothetical protein HF521_006253 [Silurus meridionalis]
MELQAQILKNFLAYFASKEATSEHEDGSYAVEFLKLKRQSTKYRTDKTYTTKAAEKQENIKKNRYKDIVPFDHSRVKLSLITSKNDTDFINANFIRGVWGPMEYIATQGPLPNTVLDFWRMLWEYNVQVIVMACREFEMGRKKCERYWPEKLMDVFVCEPFSIFCESEEYKGDYLIRTLKATFNNTSRTLKQLHYMNWPDHGVPDSIHPILDMLQDMRAFQDQDNMPICIHCSAGCGRTGALCVIDYTWNLLKKHMIPEDFSIYDLVQDMRKQRPSIVQTKEQYELVYRTIKFLFEKHLQMMESNSMQKEILASPPPPPIPTDSDSEFSDSSESEDVPEPVEENRLFSVYEPRRPEKEVQTQLPKKVARVSSQLRPPPFRPPSPPHPKRTPTDVFNGMKNWAISQISSRATATPSHLPKTDFECENSLISKPAPNQKTDLGYQMPQVPGHYALQKTDLGHEKSQALQPPSFQETDLRYYMSQTPRPQIQKTDLGYQMSQTPKPPSLQGTDLKHQKPQILGPPPVQPTDLGQQKVHILKPPRPQKPDLGWRQSRILAANLLQQTDTGYQKSQTPESPPIQQTDLENLMLQISQPTQTQKADFGYQNLLIAETATTDQTQPADTPTADTVQESTPDEAALQTPIICLTVEDPYFGPESPMSPGSTETRPLDTKNPFLPGPTLTLTSTEPPKENTSTGVTTPMSDEDSPPPLPERTPESYIMADEEPELPRIPTPTLLPCTTDSPELNDIGVIDDEDKIDNMVDKGIVQTLTLLIPPDSVSDTITGGASPPSPTPPLPERTPESFEMANDEDLLRIAVQEKPQETVLRVGKSSEWSGNSNLDEPDFKRSWSRSKSLKARLSLQFPLNNQAFAPIHIPSTEPPKSLTPPLPERTLDSFQMDVTLAPPTPRSPFAPLSPSLPKIPESFAFIEEDQSNSAPCQFDTTMVQRQRLGTSSEWAGNSQPRTLSEVMSRSKSVKVKGSKQESLSLIPQPDSDIGATAHPVLATVEARTLMDSRRPAVEHPEKTSLPKKSRTKSLKLWKGKLKSKEAPVTASVPPNHGTTAGFIFSFGTRFGKPKGPRNQPETWV